MEKKWEEFQNEDGGNPQSFFFFPVETEKKMEEEEEERSGEFWLYIKRYTQKKRI